MPMERYTYNSATFWYFRYSNSNLKIFEPPRGAQLANNHFELDISGSYVHPDILTPRRSFVIILDNHSFLGQPKVKSESF